MRVALVGPVHPYRGGIAHYTTMLHRALLERGHEVLLVSFKHQYPQWLFPGKSDKDPSQEPLLTPGARYLLDPFNPFTWLFSARVIAAFEPDALLAQWWVPVWAPCLVTLFSSFRRAFPQAPIVVTCHNVLPHERRRGDHFLSRWSLARATHYLVHSTADQEALLELLPQAQVATVQMPSFAGIIGRRYGKEEARLELGLAPDRPVALFFGLVRPYKGLSQLIEAAALLRDRLPLEVVIAGEFWGAKQPYLDLIASRGLSESVTILDRYVPNEEVGRLFDAADVLVLPYIEASQSAVVRLAYATGTPVIASAVGGLRESVEDGATGLLVTPGDARALASALERYFTAGLEAEMAHTIRLRYRAGWGALVRAIEGVIHRSRQGEEGDG